VLEWMAGKERLWRGGTWVQEGAARDIDSEGGGRTVSVSMGEKGKQKEYRGRQTTL